MSNSIFWHQLWASLMIGLGTVFWMWFIIYENAQRQLEAEKQQKAASNKTSPK